MKSFHDLYANPRRRGRAWERPVSVEFIDSQPGRPSFHINAGLRIQGELGRSEYMPKHAFRIFFRNEYGAGKLDYPLFPGSTVAKFDTLILRSGVNRSYAGFPRREEDIKLTTYSRDEWLRASQLAMSGFGARGLFVHLYLNGLYWGLYNLVERPDVPFVASHFGGREEDWEVISHEETTTNTSERFKTLHRLAAEGGLEDPEKYAAINQYLDIPHFIDYLILNWYTGNLDWGFNNWYAAVQNPSGQVRYFVWDGERTWYEGAEIYMELDEYLDRPNLVRPLLEALLENPDFRIELADRMYKHLYNDGALSEANAQLRWLAINQMIEPAIVAESARWGDARFETPLTQEDWRQAHADVLEQMTGNSDKLIRLAREAGYYPELDPPLFQQHDDKEASSAHLTITSTAPEGTVIYYTTDGSDPRQAGIGAIAPGAHRYSGPFVLAMPTHVKARIFSPAQGIWSPLNETVFNNEDSLTGRLQITEIMYNPIDGDDYEFIELKNVGNATLDLAGLSFEGIRFTFPPVRNELAPGELAVLVKNPAAFSQKYPHVTAAGAYQGQLSNQGERITVKDAAGKIILSVEYDDRNGWPVSPDGRGDSLVLVDLAQDPNEPDNWQTGRDPHGSPGTYSP